MQSKYYPQISKTLVYIFFKLHYIAPRYYASEIKDYFLLMLLSFSFHLCETKLIFIEIYGKQTPENIKLECMFAFSLKIYSKSIQIIYIKDNFLKHQLNSKT